MKIQDHQELVLNFYRAMLGDDSYSLKAAEKDIHSLAENANKKNANMFTRTFMPFFTTKYLSKIKPEHASELAEINKNNSFFYVYNKAMLNMGRKRKTAQLDDTSSDGDGDDDDIAVTEKLSLHSSKRSAISTTANSNAAAAAITTSMPQQSRPSKPKSQSRKSPHQSFEKTLRELNEKIDAELDNIKDRIASLALVTSTLETHTSQIGHQQKSLTKLTDDIEKLTIAASTIHAQSDTKLQKAKAEIASQHSTTQQQLQLLHRSLQQETSLRLQETERLQRQLTELQGKTASKRDVTQLQSQTQRAVASNSDRLTGLEKNINSLQLTVKKLTEENSALQTKAAEQINDRAEIEKLRQQLSELHKKLINEQEIIKSQKQTDYVISDIETQLGNLNLKFTNIERTIKTLWDETKTLYSEIKKQPPQQLAPLLLPLPRAHQPTDAIPKAGLDSIDVFLRMLDEQPPAAASSQTIGQQTTPTFRAPLTARTQGISISDSTAANNLGLFSSTNPATLHPPPPDVSELTKFPGL